MTSRHGVHHESHIPALAVESSGDLRSHPVPGTATSVTVLQIFPGSVPQPSQPSSLSPRTGAPIRDGRALGAVGCPVGGLSGTWIVRPLRIGDRLARFLRPSPRRPTAVGLAAEKVSGARRGALMCEKRPTLSGGDPLGTGYGHR